MMLQENYESIDKKITEACKRAGRNRDAVTLIAVSKTKPLSDIEELLQNTDAENFGENKVQELVDKYEHISRPVKWHMIGHLQTNKVKYIVDKVCLIHSVDSVNLAKTIEKEAAKHNVVVPVLIEVNVAGEESKFGVSVEETEDLIRQIKDFPHIHIDGLMTIAPFVENSEENRGVFKKLYELYVDMKRKNIDNVTMNVLSMGMTGDYQTAIEEGATMVRVGTGIFGTRAKIGEK